RIVSGDRDTFQLIKDNVTVLYPMRGVSELRPFDADAIVERYGVTPLQYPELAALVRESGDNLPGVPGLGPGFAARWLKKYGSLNGILDNIGDTGGNKGEALRENLDQVKRNRELNALVTNLELPITLDEAILVNPDRNMVSELFDALELDNIRNRVSTTFEQHLGSSEDPEPPEAMPKTAVIEDVEQWQTFLGNIEERISV